MSDHSMTAALMDRRDRRRLAALKRRADFLEHRIANYRPDGNPSRDRAERAALLWAIKLIADDGEGGTDGGREPSYATKEHRLRANHAAEETHPNEDQLSTRHAYAAR